MSVLNRDEYFQRLHERIGDDTSEDAISFIEDMTDTFNDFDNRIAGDGIDWKARYEENDASWKKRYRHRFFNGGDRSYCGADPEEDENEGVNPENIQVKDLFTKEDK